MSVSGGCEVCLSGDVEDTCTRCGQLVCEDHWDEQTGLCVECAGDVGGGRGDPDRVPGNMPDGVDTYEF